MKTKFLSIGALIWAVTSHANPPLRRFECTMGVPKSYGEPFLKSLAVDMDAYDGGVMSGLAGWKGKMTVSTSDPEAPGAIMPTRAAPYYSDLSFYGDANGIRYRLQTYSDIFDQVGSRWISKLIITTATKWKKSYDLVCERTI